MGPYGLAYTKPTESSGTAVQNNPIIAMRVCENGAVFPADPTTPQNPHVRRFQVEKTLLGSATIGQINVQVKNDQNVTIYDSGSGISTDGTFSTFGSFISQGTVGDFSGTYTFNARWKATLGSTSPVALQIYKGYFTTTDGSITFPISAQQTYKVPSSTGLTAQTVPNFDGTALSPSEKFSISAIFGLSETNVDTSDFHQVGPNGSFLLQIQPAQDFYTGTLWLPGPYDLTPVPGKQGGLRIRREIYAQVKNTSGQTFYHFTFPTQGDSPVNTPYADVYLSQIVPGSTMTVNRYSKDPKTGITSKVGTMDLSISSDGQTFTLSKFIFSDGPTQAPTSVSIPMIASSKSIPANTPMIASLNSVGNITFSKSSLPPLQSTTPAYVGSYVSLPAPDQPDTSSLDAYQVPVQSSSNLVFG